MRSSAGWMPLTTILCAFVTGVGAAGAQARPPELYQDLQLRLRRYELDVRIDYTEEQVRGSARLTLANASIEPTSEGSTAEPE